MTDEPDMGWRRSFNCESPVDTADRKLAQAEALAVLTYAECGENFRRLNDVIQDNVTWLIADLITEARHALDASRREKGAAQ